MKACEIFEMLVGFVGYDNLMNVMPWWQIRAAIRGREREDHALWETNRLQTYQIAQMMGQKMTKVSDLYSLPWDPKPKMLTDEEIEDLKRMMAEENRRIEN